MMSEDGVRASVGFFSDTGPRPDNQDFAARPFWMGIAAAAP